MVYGMSTALQSDMQQLMQQTMVAPPKPPSKIKLKRDFLREQKVSLFRINKHKLVEKCLVGADRIVIVRTKPIGTQEAELGQYEILIDCFHGYGVKILNITRRLFTDSYTYDGPCIKDTYPCFGNLTPDIQDQLQKRKLYAIVDDCVDFLKTGHLGSPYITLRQFDDAAEYLEKGYSFKKYLNNTSYPISQNQQYSLTQQYASLGSAGMAGSISSSASLSSGVRISIPATSEEQPRRTFWTLLLTPIYKINNFFRLLIRKISNL